MMGAGARQRQEPMRISAGHERLKLSATTTPKLPLAGSRAAEGRRRAGKSERTKVIGIRSPARNASTIIAAIRSHDGSSGHATNGQHQ